LPAFPIDGTGTPYWQVLATLCIGKKSRINGQKRTKILSVTMIEAPKE
jgi:hypothetical protein